MGTCDRSHLGTFHVRFAVGKRLTVNVFRQRINQLFQGCGDIWRGIAKPLPLGDRIQCSPDSFSRENLNVLKGAHLGTFPGILLKGKSERMERRSLSSRCISDSVPVRKNIDGKRFPSKDKSVISRG
ncbi:Cytochrome c family protein [Cylindrospermopsis raciborskii CS-505]|nr:Cytochrome c family protein [Cylindrospermopsis raciborskii CS-505]